MIVVVMTVVVMIVALKCLLCIAYGIIGVSGKKDHNLKVGGRGGAKIPYAASTKMLLLQPNRTIF